MSNKKVKNGFEVTRIEMKMQNFIVVSNSNATIYDDIWRPPNLSVLTPMISNTGLTHLGLEAFI